MKISFNMRLLSFIVALAISFELLPISAFAAEGEENLEEIAGESSENISLQEGEDVPQSEEAAVSGEVDANRTESEKHFRLSDGSFIAVDYGQSVHFPTMSDSNPSVFEWKDIDNTLTQKASNFTAVNGTFAKSYASMLVPDMPLFSSTCGDYTVEMSLVKDDTAINMMKTCIDNDSTVNLNADTEAVQTSTEDIVIASCFD